MRDQHDIVASAEVGNDSFNLLQLQQFPETPFENETLV